MFHFLKNAAIAGGLLSLYVTGPGRLSFDAMGVSPTPTTRKLSCRARPALSGRSLPPSGYADRFRRSGSLRRAGRDRCRRPAARSGSRRWRAGAAPPARGAGSRPPRRDRGKAHRAARQQAAEARQVDRGDGRDLGIAADGLAVAQQHDRQARARHLDGARTDAVGDDVGAFGSARWSGPRSGCPCGRLPWRPCTRTRRRSAARPAEVVVLRPPDDADRAAAVVEGPPSLRSSPAGAPSRFSGRMSSAASLRPSKPPMPARDRSRGCP